MWIQESNILGGEVMEKSKYAGKHVRLKENSKSLLYAKDADDFENLFYVEDYRDNIPGGATAFSTGRLYGHWVK